jgi:hypothetical protein
VAAEVTLAAPPVTVGVNNAIDAIRVCVPDAASTKVGDTTTPYRLSLGVPVILALKSNPAT